MFIRPGVFPLIDIHYTLYRQSRRFVIFPRNWLIEVRMYITASVYMHVYLADLATHFSRVNYFSENVSDTSPQMMTHRVARVGYTKIKY